MIKPAANAPTIIESPTDSAMGDCQLHNSSVPNRGEGQTRHMDLVMLAYSLLMSQLRQGRAQEWALCKLTTIGEACRAMLRESLRTTIR